MNFKLQIKTPLWTGDIDSKSISLQSTGIIGSLRWWTEAILRGMGKFACDPVDDNLQSLTKHCPIPKENDHNIAQYCPACLVFGATGIRKMFKLHMSGGEKIFSGESINIKPKGRNRGWYLGSGLKGKINLEIITLDKDCEENLILVPLTVAAKWGGLGAKTQHGYGVVELENYPEIKFNSFKETLKAVLKKERLEALKIEVRSGDSNSLPNIKEMFYAKVQFKAQDDNWWQEVDGIKERGQKEDSYEGYINDSRMINWIKADSIPIAPTIKNWLRFGKEITKNGNRRQVSPYKEVSNKRISQWLFGSSDENNKTTSKINLSCAYRINNNLWEFRMWGWIPKNNLPDGFDRNGFLDNLKKSLEGNDSVWNNLLGNKTREYKLKVWREFDSLRDIANKNNIENYLQSLLE